ncbi:helix-turn-helix domain-containing protein [Erwinia sp. E602]|uniref:helix-turn-helix domain-containing protein n=1 Tax=unclassified Erwinia TaxID=2622719 RepID=UPI0006FBA215|nr:MULTISPECIES: helix-turn-helix transcriptional regulator [unclassified Erwinia]KQN63770.1 transcriptional regulator [Erwinia sp. Leaf53]PLV57902.1 transcriptional regulator [Erwinia sp. B116]QUG75068.1 helix-turn-helix domain-containing protein [Erwinia sp. E602]
MTKLSQLIAERSAESQQRIREKTEAKILEIRLRQLREEQHLSQSELAAKMGVSQPAITAIESRGEEIKLATLKKYVEALGGKVSLNIEMPGGSGRIYPV